MERHSSSNVSCPRCGGARFGSIVGGPAPADPTLAPAFARAVADGIMVHEPDGEAGHRWRCASCAYEFGDGEGVPRAAWVTPAEQANLDLRPAERGL